MRLRKTGRGRSLRRSVRGEGWETKCSPIQFLLQPRYVVKTRKPELRSRDCKSERSPFASQWPAEVGSGRCSENSKRPDMQIIETELFD